LPKFSALSVNELWSLSNLREKSFFICNTSWSCVVCHECRWDLTIVWQRNKNELTFLRLKLQLKFWQKLWANSNTWQLYQNCWVDVTDWNCIYLGCSEWIKIQKVRCNLILEVIIRWWRTLGKWRTEENQNPKITTV